LSVYPAKRVVPSELHASEIAAGLACADLRPKSGKFLFNSATRLLLSKSQILMADWVAAQSQYLVGLKTREWMMSPASKEYKCFPSLVPEHCGSVPSTRGTQGAIRGDCDGVDVTIVAHQVGSQLAVCEIPDLDCLVPTSRDDDGIRGVGRETDTADPLGVTLIVDGVLALSESVPQLDGLISRTRDDLSIVGREGDAQDVLTVADKTTSSGSKVEVPEAKSTIPRTREGELTVRRDDNVLDKVRVSCQRSLWNTIVLFRFLGQTPDHHGLISRTSQDHVVTLSSSGNGSNPTTVSL